MYKSHVILLNFVQPDEMNPVLIMKLEVHTIDIDQVFLYQFIFPKSFSKCANHTVLCDLHVPLQPRKVFDNFLTCFFKLWMATFKRPIKLQHLAASFKHLQVGTYVILSRVNAE